MVFFVARAFCVEPSSGQPVLFYAIRNDHDVRLAWHITFDVEPLWRRVFAHVLTMNRRSRTKKQLVSGSRLGSAFECSRRAQKCSSQIPGMQPRTDRVAERHYTSSFTGNRMGIVGTGSCVLAPNRFQLPASRNSLAERLPRSSFTLCRLSTNTPPCEINA